MSEGVIYLDHAATSWPKPPSVIAAVAEGLTGWAGNPGRGAYALAVETTRAVEAARADICRLLNVPDEDDLVFQPGCTQAMNLVLLGCFAAGDRVVACSMEHNAVVRPLNVLASRGVEVVVVEADWTGTIDVEQVEDVVEAQPTAAIVCQHAGNVTGAVQPIADLADVAHGSGARLIVDGAQAGGHLAVDLRTLGADAWACSGHKGLLGPQGVGVLYLAPDFEPDELVSGGTGSAASEEPLQPRERPDRYEAGTPNTPGILGLGAAARLLEDLAGEQRALEQRLADRFHEGVREIDGFRVLGPLPGEPRVPIVTVVHEAIDADRLAHALDRRWGIAVRAGLHCAPWAHRTLGTIETGALRFSFGWSNEEGHVDTALEALGQLSTERL